MIICGLFLDEIFPVALIVLISEDDKALFYYVVLTVSMYNRRFAQQKVYNRRGNVANNFYS